MLTNELRYRYHIVVNKQNQIALCMSHAFITSDGNPLINLQDRRQLQWRFCYPQILVSAIAGAIGNNDHFEFLQWVSLFFKPASTRFS